MSLAGSSGGPGLTGWRNNEEKELDRIDKCGRALVKANTVHDCGGILLQVGGPDNDVQLNCLYNAFRACYGGNKDVSAL